MLVRIVETDKIEELKIVDEKTGSCYIADLIGNSGGFCDGLFKKDTEKEMESHEEVYDYSCSQETYDWWMDEIKREESDEGTC